MSALLLTSEQRQIIGHAGQSILIGAVAGSGKTTTLAHTVAHRERQGLNPQDILVLVFSPAAEQVFRERLAQAGASRQVRVSTYAAFARALLDTWQQQGRIDGRQQFLDGPEDARPFLLEAVEAAAAAHDADPDYGYDLTNLHAEILLNQMSRLKGTLDMRRFDEESDHELAESLDLPRGLLSICRQFERLRQVDQGAYLFQSDSDLVFDALGALSVFTDALPLPAYRLIVADEWHDANAGHLELLTRLVSTDTRIIAAGDREQVIHSWNGADPRFMGEAYLARFPDTRLLPLTTSFRCGATLSAAAAALTGLPFVSSRSTDTLIDLVTYDNDCASQLVDTLVSQVPTASNVRGSPRGALALADCAVLLRDAHQSIEIENALIQRDIAYVTQGFTTYFSRIEVLMLRGILHVVFGTMASARQVLGSRGETDAGVRARQAGEIRAVLRALGLFAGLSYSDREWQEAERTIIAQPDTINEFFRGQLTRTAEGHDLPDPALTRMRERFASVIDELKDKAAQWTAGEVLAYATEHLDIVATTRRLFVHGHEADTVTRSIAGFIAYAERSKQSTGDFLASLEQAQLRSANLKKNRQHLVLATVREAKGKEWKQVFLPYLVNGEFPAASAPAGEERRLFYVAITRTVEQLWLFTPHGHAHHFVQAMRLEPRRAGKPRAPAKPAEAVPARIYLNVPFDEKDAAKQLGASWDSIQRKWWISPALPQRRFAKWMPVADSDQS